MWRISSPFVYENPVSPDELIDRDVEAADLLDKVLHGRNTRLTAPRRYGKTSLLRRLQQEAERQAMQPVYVNFFGVVSVADINERIERAYREQLQGKLRNWVEGVLRTWRPSAKATVGAPVGAHAEVGVVPQPAQASLLDRLALPKRLHDKHDRRVLVVFDEFQDLLRADGTIDAVFRSEIEQHGIAVSYVFAGSHPGMMAELFGDRKRAFYGQTSSVVLDVLAATDVADYVSDRFAATGRDPGEALGPLLDTAGGHPQRTMLLAHHLWEESTPGQPADTDTWQRALAAAGRDLADEFEALWRGYSTTKQRLLASIADNSGAIYSQGNRQRHGLTRTGSHQKSLDELLAAGDVGRASTLTSYTIVDPMLALWVHGGRKWPWQGSQPEWG
jgi:hypothetical protein